MTFRQFQVRAAKARARKLTPNRRAEIAKMGGRARAKKYQAEQAGKNSSK